MQAHHDVWETHLSQTVECAAQDEATSTPNISKRCFLSLPSCSFFLDCFPGSTELVSTPTKDDTPAHSTTPRSSAVRQTLFDQRCGHGETDLVCVCRMSGLSPLQLGRSPRSMEVFAGAFGNSPHDKGEVPMSLRRHQWCHVVRRGLRERGH